jgi:hypothetical protein
MCYNYGMSFEVKHQATMGLEGLKRRTIGTLERLEPRLVRFLCIFPLKL